MGGIGSGLKRVVVSTLLLLMAVTLASCGGGGSDAGPAPKFTAAMVDNQVFYRESVAEQERGLVRFNPGGVLVDRRMDNTTVTDLTGTWAVDNSGVLRVVEGADNIVIRLVSDTANYMDITADDGSGAQPERLYKTVAFSAASLPGRYGTEDRELDGSNVLSGLAAIVGGGTGTISDGVDDNTFTWDVSSDGSLATVNGAVTDNLYLLAGGSYTGTLTVVGEEDGGSGFSGIPCMKWTRAAAAAGFDNTMLDNRVRYHEDAAKLERGLLHFAAGGALLHRVMGSTSLTDASGSWWISDAGTLYVDDGLSVSGVVLLADTANYQDVLFNDESGPEQVRLYKTTPLTSPDVLGTFFGRFKDLDGSSIDVGYLNMNVGGTGSMTGGDTFTWSIDGDGSLRISMDAEPRDITLYALAGSTSSSITLIGEVMFSGSFDDLVHLSLTR